MFSKKSKYLIIIIILIALVAGIYYQEYTVITGSVLFLMYFLWIFKKWKNVKSRNHFNIRVSAANDIVLFFLLILILRLFNIQIINNKKYREIVNKQIIGTYTEKGKRGKIYSSLGKELAYNINIYNIFIDPERAIKNKKAMQAIEEIIDTTDISKDKEKFIREIEKEGKEHRRYKIFAKSVSERTNDQITKIKKKYGLYKNEIFIRSESRRKYYKKDLYKEITGEVGFEKDATSRTGITGIEKQYEDYLKEKVHKRRTILAKINNSILPTAKEEVPIELNGKNLYLTIDENIQYILNDEMKKHFDATKSELACAIIMNPNNGKILATSIFSTREKNYRNPLFQSQFEPGSIFKPIIVASALEDGYIRKDSTFDVKDGRISKYGHTIRESSKTTRGILTLPEVLQKSSNVAMVLISDKFSDKIMEKYLTNFGFYDKTYVDYPYERKPRTRKSKHWNGLTRNTMAFGQGIAVTPIQMAAAFSAIVNGGTLYKPYLVDKIVNDDGVVIRRNLPYVVSQPIGPKTSKTMREMLEMVVKVGGGRQAQLSGYRIGGKTGTAQISAGKKGYVKDDFLTSFIGFFPADKPKYLGVIMFYKPQVSALTRYGGLVAAPVFKEVIKRVTMKKNIYSNDIEEVRVESKKKEYKVIKNLDVMPDLEGMSLRDVSRIFKNSEMEIIPVGFGAVKKQVPEAGESLEDVKKIKIYLK